MRNKKTTKKEFLIVFTVALIAGSFMALKVPAQSTPTNQANENLAVLATVAGSYVVPIDVQGYDNSNNSALVNSETDYLTINAAAPSVPNCSPAAQTVFMGAGYGANLQGSVSSGTASTVYTWSALNGAPSTGSTLGGSVFSTDYSAAGSNSVTVTTGGQTSPACSVTVVPDPTLILSTASQNGTNISANVGDQFTYAWNSTWGSSGWSENLWFTINQPILPSPSCPTPPAGTGPFSASGFDGKSPSGSVTIPVDACYSGKTLSFTYRVIDNLNRSKDALATLSVNQLPPLTTCTPTNQSVLLNGATSQMASFTAGGGDGSSYTWSAPGGTATGGSGTSFGTAYTSAGSKTVTVTSAGTSATCNVSVTYPTPVCSPSSQSAQVGTSVPFSASGGNGSFTWSAPGGSPSTGSGSSFGSSFASAGTKSVVVTSNGQTDTCSVQVTYPTPVCSPSSQSAQVGTSVHFSASGGNGSFTWSAPGGSPSTGSGSSFGSSFASAGTKSVVVTSNGQTDTCSVQVTYPGTTCAPLNLSIYRGTTASFSAGGGDGTYAWSATGGSPSSGSGSTFASQYNTVGTYTANVTSAGQPASPGCTVNVSNPPAGLQCSPATQTILPGGTAGLSAIQGTGSYTWSAPSGSPSSGSGSTFNSTYASVGNYTVTLSDGATTDTCNVIVNQLAPQCAPASQTVDFGSNATLSGSAGNGTYSWSATGGSPSSGSGSSFTTLFNTSGSHTVNITSGSQTSSCTVIVNPPPTLQCAPTSQAVDSGSNATLSASGGNGTYSWSATGGSPSSGSGSSFTTLFNTLGSHTVNITSGSQTSSCTVNVNPLGPVCAPTSQTVDFGSPATLSGSAGDGTFAWSALGGSPASGSGSTFATTFGVSGSHIVNITSAGQTSSCTVNVNPPPTPQCSPSIQTISVGDSATLGASGGSSSYNWSAPGGSPSSGSGSSFTTSYSVAGPNNVTVSSGGQISQACVVNVVAGLTCSPASQSGTTSSTFNFSAAGGSGVYSWSAPGASTPTGSGSTFQTAYGVAGTYTITVSSSGQSSQCTAHVATGGGGGGSGSSTLMITTGNGTATMSQYFDLILSGTGGTKNSDQWTWQTTGLPPGLGKCTAAAPGTTQSICGVPSQVGTYSVNLTASDGTLFGSKTITITVNNPPGGSPSCAPANQTIHVGNSTSFSVTGGSSPYSWSAPGGSPSSASGVSTFNSTYNSLGNFTVTVHDSVARSSACDVNVLPLAPFCTFTHSPTTPITPPAASTLAWGCTNATTCSIVPTVGPVQVSGTRSVTPTSTTVYTLTCSGAGGQNSFVTAVQVTTSSIIEVIP